MPGTPQIPWDEFVKTYNRMYKSNFKTPQEMVKYLYDREGTLLKVSDCLGISDNTVHLFMIKHGLPLLSRGHRGNSEYQIAFRKIKNPLQYTYREIAKMIGCSAGYVAHLLKYHIK